MKTSWVVAGMIALLAFPPQRAVGQCGDGMSGGHDHGATSSAQDETRNEKGTRQAIQRLLAQERNRAVLLEALLADPPFMREMIRRIVATPEWRALASEGLAEGFESPASARSDSATARGPVTTPNTKAVVYRCPMHRDVVSARPGNCSRCGMALRRET